MISRALAARVLLFLAVLAACTVPGAVRADDPGAALQARLARAWEEFRLEEYLQARYQFNEIAEDAPQDSPARRMALFGLATTLANQRPDPDKDRAQALFEEVVTSDGSGELAAWSLLGEARLLHVVEVGETPDVVKVRAAYQRVIDRFPDHPAAEEALIFQQSTFVATLKPEDATAALATLTGFVTKHARAKFLSPAWSLIAECQRTLGHPAERLKAELNALATLEVDPSNPYMDKALNYWRIATIAEFDVGDFATARTYYRKLATEYPTDQRRYGAEAALRRMDAVRRGGR